MAPTHRLIIDGILESGTSKASKHATLKFGKLPSSLHYCGESFEAHMPQMSLAVGPAIEESPRANHEAAHAENGPSLHIASVVAVAAVQSHIPAKAALLAGVYVG